MMSQLWCVELSPPTSPLAQAVDEASGLMECVPLPPTICGFSRVRNSHFASTVEEHPGTVVHRSSTSRLRDEQETYIYEHGRPTTPLSPVPNLKHFEAQQSPPSPDSFTMLEMDEVAILLEPEFFLDDETQDVDHNDVPKVDSHELHAISQTQQPQPSILTTSATTVATAATAVVATAFTCNMMMPALTKAMQAGMTGAHEHFKKQNAASLQTYHPGEYIIPFISAALGAGVVEVVKQVEGYKDDRDVEEILQAVEARILAAQRAARERRGGWSDDQLAVAQTWLDEGRTRYKSFVSKHSKGIHMQAALTTAAAATIVSSPVVAPVITSSTDTAAKETADNSSTSGTSAASTPSSTAASQTTGRTTSSSSSSSNDRITVADMMEATRMARELRNPSKEHLAKEDGLEALIDALEGLLEVPYLLPTVSVEKVRANIARNPALGCRSFIENVVARMIIMVDNYTKLAKDRNKKTGVAASGPGTGKTVTITQAVGCTEMPMSTLVGSAFAGVQIPDGKTAFEVFAAAVRDSVCGFRVNGIRVPCGYIYGDDFDRAWNKNGIFVTSPACRQRFFSFCKEVGDPNITTIFKSDPHLFSYHLAKDRYFPFNWSHIHFGVSCNTMPPEFLPGTADPAMLDRLGNFGADYANEIDRHAIALDHRLPAMMTKVREWYAVPTSDGDTTSDQMTDSEKNTLSQRAERQVQRICEKTAHNALAQIVQADIDIFWGTFEGRVGIRGLQNVLDMYEGYILGKLPIDRSDVNPQLFAMDEWDLKAAIKLTDAYNKPPDTDMASVESAAIIAQQVADERIRIRTFPLSEQTAILKLLDEITPKKTALEKSALLAAAQMYMHLWSHRIVLPSLHEAGQRLDSALGYFKAAACTTVTTSGIDNNNSNKLVDPPAHMENNSITQSAVIVDDIDRFPPIFAVFESIYLRLATLRCGAVPENAIVHVRFTDPAAETSTLYTSLAEVFGNVPVRFTSDLGSLFERLDEYGVPASCPLQADLLKATVNIAGNTGRVQMPSSDGETYWVNIQNTLTSNGSLIFYYQIDAKVWAIRRSALPELLKHVGKSVECKLPQNSTLGATSVTKLLSATQASCSSRLRLFDECFSKAQIAERSAAEAFVILKLTDSVLRQIDTWSESCTQGATTGTASTPLMRFQTFLGKALNQSSWQLDDNRTIDPRGMTVFLVEDTHAKSSGPTSSTSSTGAATTATNTGAKSCIIPWLVGLPPIRGRERRARAAVTAAITKLNKDRQHYAVILQAQIASGAMQPITLTVAQQSILDALMARDLDEALELRDMGFQLSPGPLDDAVEDFLNHVKNCTNAFGLAAEFPSLRMFQRTWTEKYQPERTRVQLEIARRQHENEERVRAAEEERAQASLIQQAQLQARAEVAFHHAKRDAHKKEWDKHHNSSHNTEVPSTTPVVIELSPAGLS